MRGLGLGFARAPSTSGGVEERRFGGGEYTVYERVCSARTRAVHLSMRGAVVTYRPRAPGVISSALRMRGAAAECGRGGCSTSLSYACVGCVVGTRVVACGRWLGVWWAS